MLVHVAEHDVAKEVCAGLLDRCATADFEYPGFFHRGIAEGGQQATHDRRVFIESFQDVCEAGWMWSTKLAWSQRGIVLAEAENTAGHVCDVQSKLPDGHRLRVGLKGEPIRGNAFEELAGDGSLSFILG
jgi:hypothetical protein